ncbi:integral membrane protein [Colletotrichum salicis]|uniref:Integral membrane protein n=1 Tax=Colletotrichum salicis TaxID=1209931 RepID=A0A135UC79_9PEZI|nr:integral membrane protein [Colletotrichum salicis]
MQPLLKLILRRNPFNSAKGSKQTPQYYEDYGSQSKSKSRGGGGIKLSQRKPKVKPKDDLGLTIVEGDSQENILTPTTDSNHGMSVLSGAPTLTSRQSDSSQHPADGKIIRTDFVRARTGP